MADWVLVPCLVQLRTEFNAIAPNRDHASDGSIGDAAHQAEVSDHNPDETGSVPIRDADSKNEVHAIDVDDTLRAGDVTMEKVVQFLLGRCRSGAEKRLRYIIYNRRIWSASSGWVQKTYTGASPHTEHAHFSASYDTAHEASTASWRLEDLMALTADDLDKVRKEVHDELTAFFAITPQADFPNLNTSRIGRDALNQGIPNPIRGGKSTAYSVLGDIADGLKTVLGRLGQLEEQVAALTEGGVPLDVRLSTAAGAALRIESAPAAGDGPVA